MNQLEKAEAFRALHLGGKMLVLPNSWDVPSARIFEEAGFPAAATSSAGMMVSLGYPDGEAIGIEEYASAVGRIARVLRVPLSADVVGGFGKSEEETVRSVRKVIEAGAVGINIEDFRHGTGILLPIDTQVRRLEALMRLKESMGMPFFINARTDALRYKEGDETTKMEETIKRAKAYRGAGADCVYPMGMVDRAAISRFVRELTCPTNVMVRKGLPPLGELQRLGVARVSFGPGASYAAMGLLKRIAREVMELGTYDTLVDGAISFDELNSLALPKK